MQLSDCAPDDADVVFRVLERAFPEPEHGPGAAAAGEEGARKPCAAANNANGGDAGERTVWSGSFDASRPHPPLERSGDLSGRVTADLVGPPNGVDELLSALSSAFRINDIGRASGDQEAELTLVLSAFPPGERAA
ncbi:hypothetical protein [Phaeacidiphilus oryzae]|uniref:hypothetical protein n=1 Tax=Phaeacidiphilus oryzae TaxID=348818 RepID=UPI000563889F|nr:hypothetical protein [Phaeacidiphilus oryzae]